MRKIIIDTDPGVDDAYAILAALHIDSFDCLGVCTVAGNKSIDIVTDNALRILEYSNRSNIPVYQGASSPLKRVFHDAGSVHGNNGLGGVMLPNKGTCKQNKSAIDYMIETILSHPNEIELITLGPLTNIALAIQREPNLLTKVKAIWSMGGGAYIGNVTPYAEFNYWADPHALHIVLQKAHQTRFYMVGLDATHKAPFSLEDLMYMKFSGDPIGETFWKMAIKYLKEEQWKNHHNFLAIIHDLLAVLVSADISLCTFKKAYCRTEVEGEHMGQTICDFSKNDSNIFVAFDPDVNAYKKFFFSIFFPSLLDHYKVYLSKKEEVV